MSARRLGFGACVLAFALLFTACPGGDDDDGGLLADVIDRDELRCGVNNTVPGFGFAEGDEHQGFDIDFCRAVAAAVLGDADKVEYTNISADARAPALQGDEIDVLIRNTTWTASRDGSDGLAFAMTTFYDGQGMMVRADSPYQNVDDMNDTTICVLSGTTTELNLASIFGARDLEFDPLSLEDADAIQRNFIEDRCDGWTSDKSQLAGIRSNWPDGEGGPEALRILDETLSKEPLGPVVRDGESKWFDAINWVVAATIQAEEFEITQANVDQIRRETNDPEIKRFLGEEVEGAAPTAGATAAPAAPFNAGLDLPSDFAYQIIKQVGNYAEIYNRNVGPDSPLRLERGLNALWTNGGLLYAPPYR
jgi:general L-amino acid transport system substrate-binding protein